ncbi:hypothetical protein RJ640_000576 [Escallonia rubra]|uniref:Uncharacterized protein n=1 Tax=Escallonia rubra TaxID=112253 RepID=A0AA88RQ14_9ASTE|nr:hypothetical protein RJ640_000576 [Escallonia rubra]
MALTEAMVHGLVISAPMRASFIIKPMKVVPNQKSLVTALSEETLETRGARHRPHPIQTIRMIQTIEALRTPNPRTHLSHPWRVIDHMICDEGEGPIYEYEEKWEFPVSKDF